MWLPTLLLLRIQQEFSERLPSNSTLQSSSEEITKDYIFTCWRRSFINRVAIDVNIPRGGEDERLRSTAHYSDAITVVSSHHVRTNRPGNRTPPGFSARPRAAF